MAQTLGRWDRLRFNALGLLWGNLENFCVNIHSSMLDENENSVKLRLTAKRYARLVLKLLFMGIRGNSDLTDLVEEGLVLREEVEWLQACPVNGRTLLVIGWMSHMWEDIKRANLIPSFSSICSGDNCIFGIKGGVGQINGFIGCPLPYTYVHVVYWTLQMLLSMLAIETGTLLAIYTDRAGNGLCLEQQRPVFS